MNINEVILFSESKCPSIESDVVQCKTSVCVSYCNSSAGRTHHTQVTLALMTQLCSLLLLWGGKIDTPLIHYL